MQNLLRSAARQRLVRDYVPYVQHMDDKVIETERLEYLIVMRMAGRPAEAYSIDDRRNWVRAINNVLRGQPYDHMGLWVHTDRRRVHETSEQSFPAGFARDYDQRYRQSFADTGMRVNDLYLTIIIRQPTDTMEAFLSAVETKSKEGRDNWQRDAMTKVHDVAETLKDALTVYDPEILTVEQRDNIDFTQPGEFLSFLINGRRQQVPLLESTLADYLPTARPIFSRWGNIGVLREHTDERCFGMLELRDFPDKLEPGHMDKLLALPYEMLITHSFGMVSSAAAKKSLKLHQKHMKDAGDEAKSQIKELDDALDALAAGRFLMGTHYCTILIWGNTPAEIEHAMRQVQNAMAERAIIVRPVGRALEGAFRSQLPGNWSWRLRPMPITSFNFLNLTGFHNFLSGKPDGNPWGPALTMLKTLGNTPYFLSCHATLAGVDETGTRRLGHTLIVGKSGTGKTVAEAHMLTQAVKFNPMTFIFDKDHGLCVAVLALGGKYFTIRAGMPTGWNPFQLTPTPRNRRFMRDCVEYAAKCRGEIIDTQDATDIEIAINQLIEFIDVADRRLSSLLGFLPRRVEPGRADLHARLAPWCEGGQYGWVLDNPTDLMDMEQYQTIGFDLTELYEDPIVRGASTLYLMFRAKSMVDGSRRSLWIFDECQHPLKDARFMEDIQDLQRTGRKMDHVMVFATQEPDVITSNPIGRSLIQQCATKIFLPNPDGRAKDYLEDGFGLKPNEFELVMELGEFSRQMYIKQGRNGVTVRLDLSQMRDALLIFSGSEDLAALAYKAIAQAGDDPANWLPLYLEWAKAR